MQFEEITQLSALADPKMATVRGATGESTNEKIHVYIFKANYSC